MPRPCRATYESSDERRKKWRAGSSGKEQTVDPARRAASVVRTPRCICRQAAMMRSGNLGREAHQRARPLTVVLRPACSLSSDAISLQLTARWAGWVLAGTGEARRAPIGVRLAGTDALSLATIPPHMESAALVFVRGDPTFARGGKRSRSANSRVTSAAVSCASPTRRRLALMLARWISAAWAARDACGAACGSDVVIDVFLECEDGSAPEVAGARDEANGADARCFPAAAAIAATRGAKRLTVSGSPAASCAYRSKPPSQIATTPTPPPSPCHRSPAGRCAEAVEGFVHHADLPMCGEHRGVEDQRPVRISPITIRGGYLIIESKQLTDRGADFAVLADQKRLGAREDAIDVFIGNRALLAEFVDRTSNEVIIGVVVVDRLQPREIAIFGGLISQQACRGQALRRSEHSR